MEAVQISKAPTGINGLDEILNGGLPMGRCTLVCGGTGSGKTLIGMEFIVNGVTRYDEPGVFVAFEETAEDLSSNFSSLGFNLEQHIKDQKLVIDYVHLDPEESQKVGAYSLDGLFIRLDHAIQKINAKRVVLDTIETLFSVLDTSIVRAELNRLFRWLKSRGVTAVITAERSGENLTRHGIEEFVSDCVILLDHRVDNQISNRRLRVIKYRGSAHGTNEYPFLIDYSGISVVPITSIRLDYNVSNERISSGVAGLDAMLSGKGFYRGTTILVSGIAGTGKSSLAASLVNGACERGEKALYFAYEEGESQIVRNVGSIGIHLQRWIDAGLLQFRNVRSSFYTLEMHLAVIHKAIDDFNPSVVVIDPVTNFDSIGNLNESHGMITRLIDFLKGRGITAMLTNLSNANAAHEFTAAHISSLMDTWLLLRNVEHNGERNRILDILKSRGMEHSNQVSEFLITENGIEIIPAYLGPSGVFTGSARIAQEAQDKLVALQREQEVERRKLQIKRKRAAIEAQIASLQAELHSEVEELELVIGQELADHEMRKQSDDRLARSRYADLSTQSADDDMRLDADA